MTLTVDTLNAITRDISTGTSIVRSPLRYTQEMREARRGIQRRWSAYLIDHPDAVLSFPEELEVDDREPDPTFEDDPDDPGMLRPSNAAGRKLAGNA